MSGTPTLKLGKLPARNDAYSFKLAKYLDVAPGYIAPDKVALPTAPTAFGYYNLVEDYGMLANDRYGDCVWAGAAHETMLWTSEANEFCPFSEHSVLQDYSVVTGFREDTPSTDQGTDMEAAAKYRRKTGVIDAFGKRHTVDAYLELPGVFARSANNATRLIPALATSAYVFGAVGLGIQFPSTAMKQFNAGKPWSVVPNATIEGGHYISVVGRVANGNFLVVTWGKLQEVTPDFITQYADEAIVYVSLERLKDGKTLYGFDVAALRADLSLLSGTSPAPTPIPVIDPNVAVLDKWASSKHIGATAKAAAAWKAIKAQHNL